MRVLPQRAERLLVEDALAGAADVDDHQAGGRRGEDVFALQDEQAAQREGLLLEEPAVVLALVDEAVVPAVIPGLTRNPVRRGTLPERIVSRIRFDDGHRDPLVLLETASELGQGRGALGVEVDAGAEAVAPERLLDAGVEDLEDDGVVLELDLRLGRVDVDVHGVRVRLQEDEVGGRDPVRDHLLVGLHHGLVEVRAAEIASVDEEILVAGGLPGGVGAADEAAHAHHGGVGRQVHDVPDHVAAK